MPNAKVCPKNKIPVIKTYLLKWHLPIDCIVASRLHFSLTWVIMFNAEERNPQRFCLPIERETGVEISRTHVIFDYYLFYRNNIFFKTVQYYIIS